MVEEEGAIQDSPLEEEVQDVEVSSTEEEQEEQLVEPTTEEQGVDQNVPYDRFKEVNDEKNYWRQQAQQVSQLQRPVAPQEEVDPYAQFQDPQTKLFYQEIDKRIAKTAEKIAEAKGAQLTRQNDLLTRQMAQIQHKQFKEENTDVREGSQEELEIAQYVSQGMPLDKATWAVMGPKRVAGSKVIKQQNSQHKKELKAKANLATGSIPPSSGLPQQESKSFIEDMKETLAKEWNESI